MKYGWRFTDLEFYALWFALEGEGLPYPFFFHTELRPDDVFQAARKRAREDVRRRHGNELDGALRAIRDPDIRITVVGRSNRESDAPAVPVPTHPTGSAGSPSPIRLLAVRRDGQGYLVTQLPGKGFWYAGGFTVEMCDAVRLADIAVAALPAERPGRRADLVLPDREDPVPSWERPRERLDYSFGASAWNDSFVDTISDRARRFLAIEPIESGHIDIVQGRSLYGPRGRTSHRLEWRDHRDDGRYVIDDQRPPVATAADTTKLIGMINTRIAAVVRAIKDERA